MKPMLSVAFGFLSLPHQRLVRQHLAYEANVQDHFAKSLSGKHPVEVLNFWRIYLDSPEESQSRFQETVIALPDEEEPVELTDPDILRIHEDTIKTRAIQLCARLYEKRKGKDSEMQPADLAAILKEARRDAGGVSALVRYLITKEGTFKFVDEAAKTSFVFTPDGRAQAAVIAGSPPNAPGASRKKVSPAPPPQPSATDDA